MSTERTIAVIGLGNPGKEYEKSRHNTGFMAVEAVSQSDDTQASWESKKNLYSHIASKVMDGTKLILVKPQTFMNLSGKSVAAVTKFYSLEPKHLWVIHDDLDFPLGKIQVRFGGGLAGHHGLESIAQTLGTSDFGRIRVGIRGHELKNFHDQHQIDTNTFVMGAYTTKELDLVHKVIAQVCGVVQDLCNQKIVRSHTLTVAGYETFTSPNAP